MDDNIISSVVKIISQNISFNWFDPYKTADNFDGIGTGFFIDDSGTILTCAHVVDTTVKVQITVPSDGNDRKDVEILSICPSSDLALLRVLNYDNKSYLEFAKSDDIKKGDKVTAVGYPLGQNRYKYSAGIISGIQGSLIQTDAPINPGNSGGPLLNSDNKVIGVNSEKIAAWAADNIGYSVPISDFNLIKDKMYKKEKIIMKPSLVCYFNKADKYMVDYFGMTGDCSSGYYINNILKTSPLYNAGIRNGDLICQFDNYKIDNHGETHVNWTDEKINLKEIMNRYNIGDVVEIKYWNNKKKKIIETKITFNVEHPYKIRKFYPSFEKIDYEVFAGMVIMNLTMNHIEDIFNHTNNLKIIDAVRSYKEDKNRLKNRLIITNILPGSYLRTQENIKVGSIISRINNIKVYTLEQVRKALLNIQIVDNKKFLVIKTKSRTKQIVSIDKIIEDEPFLAEKNKYNISPIFNKYKNSQFINITHEDNDDVSCSEEDETNVNELTDDTSLIKTDIELTDDISLIKTDIEQLSYEHKNSNKINKYKLTQ